VELNDLTLPTVLLGPNGSGKSTVFDVFNFLSECFQFGLRHAWDQRQRAREIKTRGQTGPLVIELKYRERPKAPFTTYHLATDEKRGSPVVTEKWLAWTRYGGGKPFRFLNYKDGRGEVINGAEPDDDARPCRPSLARTGRPLFRRADTRSYW
jgi:predicted ATPase